MSLTVPQLRAIQEGLSVLISSANPAAADITPILQQHSQPIPVTSAWVIDAQLPDDRRTGALFFRYPKEPHALANLIFSPEVPPPSNLSLDTGDIGNRFKLPLIIGLHYLRTGKEDVSTADYLAVGAAILAEEPVTSKLGYIRIKNKGQTFGRLAAHLFGIAIPRHADWRGTAILLDLLNRPVEELPFPEGSKRDLLGILSKAKIRYVAELVQKNPEDLVPSNSRYLPILRGMISKMGLSFGMKIPGWRPPTT